MGLHKILKIIAFALAILGAIIVMVIIAGDGSSALSMSGNLLYVAYAVLAIVLALVIVFVLKGLFAGDIKKTLITVGAFAVVLFISYAISSGTDLDLTPFTDKGLDVNEGTSKMVGAGLYAFYALGIIAIGSMLLGGATKILKR